jgi:hypothetical protein
MQSWPLMLRTNQVLLLVLHQLIEKQSRQALQSHLYFRSYSLPRLGLLFLHQLPLAPMHQLHRLLFPQHVPQHRRHRSGGLLLVGCQLLLKKMSDHTPFSKLSHFWHNYPMILILSHCYRKYVLSVPIIDLARDVFASDAGETRASSFRTTAVSREMRHPGET